MTNTSRPWAWQPRNHGRFTLDPNTGELVEDHRTPRPKPAGQAAQPGSGGQR